MAGRQAGSHLDAAKLDLIFIAKQTVCLDRFKRERVSPLKIILAPVGQKRGIKRARYELRARHLFEQGEAARMVKVRVAVDQYLYVFELEAEKIDVLFDHRNRFGKAAVEQYVAGGRGDEKRADFGRADIVNVADDLG